MTVTLSLGQAHSNINFLETTKLTESSLKEKVMPREVLKLFAENYTLEPGSFEQFRAKSIGLLLGVTLPITILALTVYTIYRATQTDFVIQAIAKVINTIAILASKTFTAIANSSTSLAASAGGVAFVTFTLTRPGVSSAIGSFVGSMLGTVFGSSIVSAFIGFFRTTENTGYNWWYDQYRFGDRIKQIQGNKTTITHLLTDTYNEMATDLNKQVEEKSKEHDFEYLNKLKKSASLLQDRLPTIRAIFVNNGIHQNECIEITLSLSEAIGAVVSFGEDK